MPDTVGSERIHKGQHYTLVGHRPYTNRNGDQIILEIWRSQCATCGAWFEAPRSSRAKRFELNRRCQDHKAPGRRVEPSQTHLKRQRREMRAKIKERKRQQFAALPLAKGSLRDRARQAGVPETTARRWQKAARQSVRVNP